MTPIIFHQTGLFGKIKTEKTEAPVHGSAWYVADSTESGLVYYLEPGILAGYRYLSADMLLDGTHLAVFVLHLQEGEGGRKAAMMFAALNQCAARIRIPLEAVNQNRWAFPREGAWLKPMSGGDVVRLEKVDRMTLTLLRKSAEPVRWCITPFTATADAPPLLDDPLLPKGPLLDELGQSTLIGWTGKSKNAEEVTTRLHAQLADAKADKQPGELSRWGGWTGKKFRATGYFRTEHDARRWWLVDPEGCAFWSAGLDCVNFGIGAHVQGLHKALAWMPEATGEYAAARDDSKANVDFLRANFIRAFGADAAHDAWEKIALGLMRRLRFNTVGNWSEWQAASKAAFPYVRPLDLRWPRTPMIFRDFPDVFHPAFEEDVKEFAAQLAETRDDPALLGYFLMNEPTWGFAAQTPAEGMWLNDVKGPAREEFARFVAKRNSSVPTAQDFTDFSAIIAEKLFESLSSACRAVDPHHLNLGARYHTVPPEWAIVAMQCFDVFSINCYKERVNPEAVEKITRLVHRPVLVGEWHFGALDAGLPSSGIGHVRTQEDRGKAYRVYAENAAALPGCVGVHWFTLYDESALGRFDGENYNIGFLDICNRPYTPLAEAATLAHERIYKIADGTLAPTNDVPEYLPLLFV